MRKVILIAIILFFIPQSFASDNAIEEEKETIFHQMAETLENVDSNIRQFIKSKDESFLFFAETFNQLAFGGINKWFKREVTKIVNMPYKEGEFVLKQLEMVRNTEYKEICKNYNKIATYYEEIKRFDKAKFLYKTVIREFDPNKFENCFREAEISLTNLANK